MTLDSKERTSLIAEHRRNDSDTGSPEVQIALLTRRIEEINRHREGHVKDHQAGRGLLRLVHRRQSLLGYLRSVDIERYRAISERLGMRTK